jgi:hypothetical protein
MKGPGGGKGWARDEWALSSIFEYSLKLDIWGK